MNVVSIIVISLCFCFDLIGRFGDHVLYLVRFCGLLNDHCLWFMCRMIAPKPILDPEFHRRTLHYYVKLQKLQSMMSNCRNYTKLKIRI